MLLQCFLLLQCVLLNATCSALLDNVAGLVQPLNVFTPLVLTQLTMYALGVNMAHAEPLCIMTCSGFLMQSDFELWHRPCRKDVNHVDPTGRC